MKEWKKKITKTKRKNFSSQNSSLQSLLKKSNEVVKKKDSSIEYLNVIDSKTKQNFLDNLKQAIDCGCKLGQEMIVGINSVSRSLEKIPSPEIICLARDCQPHSIHDDIITAAKIENIPILVFPSITKELGALLKIKRASCLAVMKSKSKTVEETGLETIEEAQRVAAIDNLRDFLLELSKRKFL